MSLLNIFNSGGLWVFPFITAIVFLWELSKAIRASKSGSVTGGGNGQKTEYSDQNVPIYKTGRFYWSLCWLVATIILLWWLISDYKGV